MKNLKDILFALSQADGVGSIKDASNLAYEMLSKCCETHRTDSLTVIGYMQGKGDYTLMLDSHIDQIAAVVTDVDKKGFLTVAKAGGADIRALPSRRVTVHGKERVTAVFCSTPPHLAKGEQSFESIGDIKLDTALGERAGEVISVGDYVTFNTSPCELLGTKLCGRSFDDRAGVACLIKVAQMLKDKELPFNVAFVLSDGEELGLRGAKTAAFKVNPNEAIAVDVSFGDGLGISEEESARLGSGAMIGIAPTLDRGIFEKMTAVCKEKGIPHTFEVMGGKTGTNADVISVNREGVKTGMLSIPLRNMHTDCEIADLKDLESVCNALYSYILSGGVMNA